LVVFSHFYGFFAVRYSINNNEGGSIFIMITYSGNIADVLLRWLMSAAVLFYAHVPQVGVCHCGDQCCCKSATVADGSAEKTAYCCSVGGMSSKDASQDSRIPHSCPCVKILDNPDPMIHSSAYSSGALDVQTSDAADIVTETQIFFHPTIGRSFNSGCVAAVGMRLHLFLQVLLI
jgi:hypothetical protein